MRKISLAAVVVSAVLLITAIRAGLPAERTDASETRITVLDVGQGDAVLVDGPGDAEILIDGGPTPDLARRLSRALGNDRSLDLVVLTHPHADHVIGLADVLRRYDVGRILLTGVIHTTRDYEEFLTTIRDRHIPTTVAVAGQTYDVGPARLAILFPFADQTGVRPENLNSASIVAMLMVGVGDWKLGVGDESRRILLTGDAEADVEALLLDRHCTDRSDSVDPCPRLRADVLKVPHHGSQDSSSTAFLVAVRPHDAIISVGRRNEYHHPHPRALKRLERIGARIWRTDRDGDVAIRVADQGLSVSGAR
ncbi:MBL fold metallo-hydrolase [Candidatus Uhrbacteria bacterium]|nr:MBL fold metallo-hydrolase [Candidatus Uhrbacteria bacterium]